MMAQDNNSFNNDLNEDEEECPLMHENAGKQAIFKKSFKKVAFKFCQKKSKRKYLHEFILKLKQETQRIVELHPVEVEVSLERKRRINEWRY